MGIATEADRRYFLDAVTGKSWVREGSFRNVGFLLLLCIPLWAYLARMQEREKEHQSNNRVLVPWMQLTYYSLPYQ